MTSLLLALLGLLAPSDVEGLAPTEVEGLGPSGACGLHGRVEGVAAGGGKIAYEKSYDDALARAKAERRPVMLYFAASWCGFCKELDEGPFSDDAVVTASRELANVLIDSGNDPADLFSRYRVKLVPALIFLDADGRRVDEHRDKRDVASVLRKLREVAKMFGRSFWTGPLDQALGQAKQARRPILICCAKESDRDAAARRLREALGGLLARLEFVRADSCAGVTEGLVVLDPTVERPEEHPLARLGPDWKPEDLRKKISDLLGNWGRR